MNDTDKDLYALFLQMYMDSVRDRTKLFFYEETLKYYKDRIEEIEIEGYDYEQ